jgi:histone acetyltransferase (RNA polymerase elongator complex component)
MKEYFPLTEREAIDRCYRLLLYFSKEDITVLRCGLHPSEELADGGAVLAGPFHPAFRQKCENMIFKHMIEEIIAKYDPLEIHFNPVDTASIFGFKEENNIKDRDKAFSMMQKDKKVTEGDLEVLTEDRTFIFTRTDLANRIFS